MTFGQSHGNAYPVPTKVVVFFDDGSQEEATLKPRLSKNQSHVYGFTGRMKRAVAKGFQVGLTLTKVGSGDLLALAEAREERARKQALDLSAKVAQLRADRLADPADAPPLDDDDPDA